MRQKPILIAVGNLKGGCGKSTLAINLACALAQQSSVCVVDCDPQGTATIWAIRGQLPIRIEPMPLKTVSDAVGLQDNINRIGAVEDIVLIDLPALVSAAMASAFMAADLVLIPTSPSAVDITATVRTIHYLRKAECKRHDSAPKSLIVPTLVDCDYLGRLDDTSELRKLGLTLTTPIRRSRQHPRAFGLSSWVGEIAPHSRAFKDIRSVADQVNGMLLLGKSARPEAGILGRNKRAHVYSAGKQSKISRLLKLGTPTPKTA